MAELTDPEDAKLLVLARAHRSRAGSSAGAAVRDTDGRTYSAVAVNLASLRLSAVQLAVATSVSSGSRGLEAVVIVGVDEVADDDLSTARDFAGAGVPVLVASAEGDLVGVVTT